MNKSVYQELMTAYRMAVEKFGDVEKQIRYFELLTDRGRGIFNVLANYEKSKKIRRLQAL